MSPIRILDLEAKVSDLLDPDTNWWKVNLVHEIFTAKEAELICSTAVCMPMEWGRTNWCGHVLRMVSTLCKEDITLQRTDSRQTM